MKHINEAQIVEKWAPRLSESTGVEDKNKLKWMSVMAHYHNLYEATTYATLNSTPGMGATLFPGNPGAQTGFVDQTKGSGDKPFTLLPLAMQVASQTVGLDMVPVVPMQGPMGILTYVDFVYANGKLDSTETPSYIKIPVTGAELETAAPAAVAPSTGTPVTVSKSTGTGTLTGSYLGTSRVDGFAIVKIDALGGGATTIADVLPGTSGTITVTDGTNSYTSPATAATAELVKALEDQLPGFVGAQDFAGDNFLTSDPMSRETGESSAYNQMGLTFYNKSVEAKTYQVAIAVTREQLQDAKQFGFDVMAQSNAIIANELTQSLNKNILERMRAMGATNHEQILQRQGINFNMNFSGGTVAATDPINLGRGRDGATVSIAAGNDIESAATNGDNRYTLNRRILGRILSVANMINIRGRRGNADGVVTNGNIASVLQDISGFVPAPMSNTISQAAGSLYPVGTIAGMTVYVDPNMSWSDNRVTVFRKGDGNSPGLVMMPYLMAESVETIAEGTMAPKIAAKTRYALVEAGHHPQTNYVTFSVEPPAGNFV